MRHLELLSGGQGHLSSTETGGQARFLTWPDLFYLAQLHGNPTICILSCIGFSGWVDERALIQGQPKARRRIFARPICGMTVRFIVLVRFGSIRIRALS